MMQLIRENKRLIHFLLICLTGYLLWVVLYNYWIAPSQKVDFWLCDIEAKEVIGILDFFGYSLKQVVELNYKQVFYFHGSRLIGLASACNGLVLFPLFSCFIIATDGAWKRKIVYVIVGCFLIYHVNILRIIGLILVRMYYPTRLDFNHKYTFTVIVYSFIFYLWYLWINRYSGIKHTTHE